jgi:hypothetical protein
MTTEQLEQKIEQMQTRIRQIDHDMAGGDIWRDPRKCDQLGAERQKLVADLEPFEFEWMRRAES